MLLKKFAMCIAAIAVIGNTQASAATVLIDPTTNNGSFELLGGVTSAVKAKHWDTDANGDVDNWTLWDASAGGLATASNDSGTDAAGMITEGTRVAFLQGNNSAYNLTSHVIAEGDIFTYTWDWTNPGRSDAIASLAYSSGADIIAISGSDSTNPDTVTAHIGLGATYTVLAGDPAIGGAVALTIAANGSGYPEVDNFVLSVSSVPEPGSLITIALALCSVCTVGRRHS